MVKRPTRFSMLIVFALAIIMWILINPQGYFGISFFGLTTYGAVPVPYFDVKIYGSAGQNGVIRIREVEDRHVLAYNETLEVLNWSNAWAEALVIGTGYSENVVVDERITILNITPVPTYVLPTPDAIQKFNELKSKGIMVSAIIHSTC